MMEETLVDTGVYLPEVVAATPVRHGVLDLVFSDGARRRVDIRPLLRGALARLHDEREFNRVEVALGTAVWRGAPFDLDIAPETLYSLPEAP